MTTQLDAAMKSLLSGKALSTEETLSILKSRQVPSRKECFFLDLVIVSGIGKDKFSPLPPKRLAFLKRHLSKPIFERIVSGLSVQVEGDVPAPVSWWDVEKVRSSSARIRRLEKEIVAARSLAALVVEQKTVAG